MQSRWVAVLSLLAALTAVSAAAEGVSRRVEYRSPVDDSLQAYGVYLPESAPPRPSGYPAVLHGHGYGWRVSTRFGSFQREWAERHGWVLIHLNARGPNFYEGVGDLETLRVVEHAAENFGLDLDRIYMTGGSMGGTGALRHGLRHPDVFAAVMGVDGWTDYRLWHHHWYARKDYRDLIEEFRRPLLEAASSLYWAERGEHGTVGHIVDGGDTTVLPENGLRLWRRLRELQDTDRGAYDQQIIFNPELGHGRGTDYRAIYEFFRGRRRIQNPRGFHVETTVLPHGELYWGRIEDFLIDGMSGSLRTDTQDDLVTASTRNLSAFTLFLRASPVADRRTVRVFVDGFPVWEGPPETLTVEAQVDATGDVAGWQVRMPDDGPVKHPGLCGPVGDAFVRPFAVAWATDGPPEQIARHRTEAQQFARDWNAFMVHGPGVEAVPEEKLSPADMASHTLVIFGSLDTSSLLQRADSAHSFPIRVRNDGVVVRDPVNGIRRYTGRQFGALMCHPNPLTDFSTYLVVANRRICTKPDSGSPQLLAYDLEKLSWAYPDYVIFNNDQSQLPHVLNVNNKPPVTCYEAAYFVEGGFFSDRWQIDTRGQLRRVTRQKPEDHRLIHLANVSLERTEGRPGAAVHVVDSGGDPIHTARVTGRWWGTTESVASAPTDEEGHVWFPAPSDSLEHLGFEVVSVMATGCTWERTADAVRGLAPTESSPGQLDMTVLSDRPTVRAYGATPVRLAVHNAGPRERRVRARLSVPSGRVAPMHRTVAVPAGERTELEFNWWPQGRSLGTLDLRAQARVLDAESASCECAVPVRVLPGLGLPVVVTEVTPSDQTYGEPWRVETTIRNVDCEQSVEATVHCAIMEARCYPTAKTVSVGAGETANVVWTGPGPLPKGDHTVRITVEGAHGATATEKLAVR